MYLNDVSDYLNTSKSTIFRLEEGQSSYSIKRLLEFMNFYRVGIDQLLDACHTLDEVIHRESIKSEDD